MAVLNILIVGVGGQGTLLAGKIMGEASIGCGYDVKISEVHGMAQRGGSVVTHVRMGVNENIMLPLVEKGCADILIAFEELEALRWLPYLKQGGKLVANIQQIDPMPVITGAVKYPDNIKKQLESACPDAILTDALATAKACGSLKAVNMVLLGAVSVFTPISKDIWISSITASVPAKFSDVNTRAFNAGYILGEESAKEKIEKGKQKEE